MDDFDCKRTDDHPGFRERKIWFTVILPQFSGMAKKTEKLKYHNLKEIQHEIIQ